MQLSAPHQAPGDVGRLQRRALGRRMGGEISGIRNEDVPALVGVAPDGELPDSRLQHLVGMKARVFPQHCMRERGDQRLRRMAEFECRATSLAARSTCLWRSNASSRAVRIASSSAGRSSSCSALAWNAGRRHIEVAREIEGHRSVQDAAHAAM